MSGIFRIIELVLFSAISYLPFFLVALLPYRNSLRFPKFVTALFLVLLTALRTGIASWIAFRTNGLMSASSIAQTLLITLFLLLLIKAPIGKKLFTLFLMLGIGTIIISISKTVEGLLFPTLACQIYRYSFSLSILLVTAALALPIGLYLKRVILPVFEYEHTDHDWLYLWMIPCSFYYTQFCTLYLIKDRTAMQIALRPRNAILFSFLGIGASIVYYAISKLLKAHEENRLLEQQNAYASIQLLQYRKLQDKINETRQARHDIRHHLTTMRGFLDNQEYERLDKYLSAYSKTVIDTNAIRLCNNPTLNIILLHFASLAKENGIDFSVSADVPRKSRVPETDLTVLFGNLLENAIDACIADTEANKRIIVRILERDDSFCLTIDNSFSGTFFRQSGKHSSTKHPGDGIGISSCESIVERYNGTMKMEQNDDHLVMVSVALEL